MYAPGQARNRKLQGKCCWRHANRVLAKTRCFSVSALQQLMKSIKGQARTVGFTASEMMGTWHPRTRTEFCPPGNSVLERPEDPLIRCSSTQERPNDGTLVRPKSRDNA